MARTSRRARRSSPLYLPGAFDLFTPSKELVLRNIWIFGPLYAVPLIFYIHSWLWAPKPGQHLHLWQHTNGFSSGWPGSSWPSYLTFMTIGFSILWFLIIGAAGTIAQIMAQKAQLDAAQDRILDFKHLWAMVKEIGWRLLGLYIIIGIIVGIGFVLLIIPGLILLRRYLFAPYVMIEKKTGIRDSLERSAALSGRNTASVWGIIGVMFLIGLLNILPYIGGLAAFVFGSLYSVAPALRYEQLKKLT
jgi:hypothetical protein